MIVQVVPRTIRQGGMHLTRYVLRQWAPGFNHRAVDVTRSMILAVVPTPIVALDKAESVSFPLDANGEQAASLLAAQLVLAYNSLHAEIQCPV